MDIFPPTTIAEAAALEAEAKARRADAEGLAGGRDVADGAVEADGAAEADEADEARRGDRGDSDKAAAGVATDAAAPLLARVPGQRGVLVRGTLEQALDKVSTDPTLVSASGTIKVPFEVSSPDLTLFRVAADVVMRAVRLEVPALRAAIIGVDGSLPFAQEVRVEPEAGVSFVGGAARNAWSRWRYQDHRPYLPGNHFVSVREMRLGKLVAGPLAANVDVDRNLFRLSQMELRALGGLVTGQCILDMEGDEPLVRFRGSATGLRPTRGSERLDAHAAISFRPLMLAVDGRIHVLRVGPNHLRDMLEVWDPYYEDLNANRLRLALKAGYPKQMEIRMQHGFLNARVELGGLGAVAKLEEIRGIALGPIFQRYVPEVLALAGLKELP
jgi:hypothetical protein